MEAEKFLKTVGKAIEDKKGKDIVALKVGEVSPVADYLVIASGDVPTHTRAIADEVIQKVKEETGRTPLIEGYQEGRWIALDYGDTIVHVFLPELREYYELERLWQDAPQVKITSEEQQENQ